MRWKSVVLPEPLGPTTATRSPLAISSQGSVSAVNVAVVPGRENVLTRLRTTMTGVDGTPYTS